VVDAFPVPGGQYFMQPAVSGEYVSDQTAAGREAIANAGRAGVEFLGETEIFAAYPGFSLFASGSHGPHHIECRCIVVATGAHDRVMAFPGWTLPGVMTAGAGQRLAKVHGVLPGKRVVIAGSGVFLFAVADVLIAKGAAIAALVEARKPGVRLALHLLHHPERWREVSNLLSRVRRKADRLIFGKVVTEAYGGDRVEGIRLATEDLSRREDIRDVDALLISHGFQPSIEITSLLGCRHRFDDDLGGWFVAADPDTGLTSVNGVFAAGEVLGIAGARPAMLSGELAGMSAAESLGFLATRTGIRSKLKTLQRDRHFGHGLGRLFSPNSVLASLVRESTVLCRCEEVTFGEIRKAYSDGARSAYESKIWTRAGMGRCQGRMCRMSVTHMLARESGRTVEQIGFNRSRVPIRPTHIADVFAAMENGTPDAMTTH
jgi:NADPH-dependent 2,4-dienoyl-CoA reductase/sulfur reductase-like enzyme